jgi:DNA repair protein RadC
MIRDMPNGERPRERLRDFGPGALSNAELLAILLRTGTASESVLDLATRLLAQFQGMDGLARASHGELCQLHGLGEAKAAQLQAVLEMGRRLSVSRSPERPTINAPGDVAALLQAEMALLDQEHFRVLVLDTKNHVMAAPDVFVGSVNATTIRTAEVFREAVRLNCPSVIVVHNHPSGDPEPSAEDANVTRELVAAGKTLDIDVLHHVVIGRDGFVSLKERKLSF